MTEPTAALLHFAELAGLRDLLISTVVFAVIWFAVKRPQTFSIRSWLASTGTLTDVAYWFTNRLVSAPLMIAGAAYVFGTLLPLPLLLPGLQGLPFAVQIVLGLLLYDFLAYWRHRWSHSDLLWPIHAPHHSSTHLNWLSGSREHFLDIFLIGLCGSILLLLIGFPADAVAAIGLIRLYWVNFVHMDLNFSLGPLDYIIVTPRFHRWHHVPDKKGGQNYSGFFSFYDLIFGTFYLPADRVAERFGPGEPNYPNTFSGQLLQPFIMYAQRISDRIKSRINGL